MRTNLRKGLCSRATSRRFLGEPTNDYVKAMVLALDRLNLNLTGVSTCMRLRCSTNQSECLESCRENVARHFVTAAERRPSSPEPQLRRTVFHRCPDT